MEKVKAIFLKRFLANTDLNTSGVEYYACKFTDVKEKGRKKPDFSTKESKLLKAAKLRSGTEYEITFGEFGYPIEIKWGTGKDRVYIKNQNSIIRVDKDGNETNLSANTLNNRLWQMVRETNSRNKKK